MPSSANRSDCAAAPLLQTTIKGLPIEWRLISAADRPMHEDTWIARVLPDEVQRLRWRNWCEQPRYAVTTDVGPWALIAMAFRPNAGDNPLLDLFRNIDADQRATAWAVSKATRQIYRLALPLPEEHSSTVNAAASLAGAEPNLHHRLRLAVPQIRPEAWQTPELLARWEAHVCVPANWVLSQCHRSLMHVARQGEFGSFTPTDQLGHGASLFDDALEIETLPAQQHQRLHARLYRRERILSIAVMKCIVAAVDQHVIRQMREAGLGNSLCAVSLNWLTEVPPLSQARKRRVQALQAAPLLLPWLLGNRGPTRLADPDRHQGAAAVAADAYVDHGDNICDPQSALSDEAFFRRAAALSHGVDCGDPLYPLLAQLTGLTLRTLRHLRLSDLRIHHLTERVDHRARDQTVSRLRWLDAIAVDQWPQTATQWRMWSHSIKELLSQCDFVSDLMTPAPHPWIANVAPADGGNVALAQGRGARALDFYQTLAQRRWRLPAQLAYDRLDDEDFAHAIAFLGMELRDFARAMRETAHDDRDDFGDPLLLPLPMAVIDLLQHWKIEAWWDASQRWHAALTEAGIPPEHHGGQRFAEHDTPPWLPLLEHAFRVGDVNASEQEVTDTATGACGLRTVRFLNTREMLHEEANAMQHCVGTFVRRCVTGRWHIASVTDADGVRCSTASFQMSFAQGRWTARLVEHRSLRNAPPSVQCVQVLRAVEVLLNKQVMQHRFVQLEAARVERAAVIREFRFDGSVRGQDVSLAALKAALPMDVFDALVRLQP